MQKNKFVAVEANIGVGKSTALPLIVEALNAKGDEVWDQLQEPVDDPIFAELLKEFYEFPDDPDVRIRFQMYLTNRRSELVKELDTNVNYVVERSLFSDLIFSQANFLGMEMPSGQYLNYYYDIKRRLTDYPQIGVCIYLKTSAEVAYHRMLGRDRGNESGIPLTYMEDINNFHDACLPQICREYNSSLLEYDWTKYGDVGAIADDILNHFNCKED